MQLPGKTPEEYDTYEADKKKVNLVVAFIGVGIDNNQKVFKVLLQGAGRFNDFSEHTIESHG